MRKTVKRNLTRCVIFLAVIIVTMSVSGIINSFVRAETTAVKIETNEEYFSGAMDMRTVEVTRASSNTLLGVVDFILTHIAGVSIFLFMYNGGLAVYKYFKIKEKKNEKG
jgi:hypothetical protein